MEKLWMKNFVQKIEDFFDPDKIFDLNFSIFENKSELTYRD